MKNEVTERFVLKAGHLIDGSGAVPAADVAVVAHGAQIVEILPARAFRPMPSDVVVDAGTAWVLPGLIDAHVHICGEASPEATYVRPTAALAVTAIANTRASLAAGYTAMRDLGARDQIDVAIRDAIDAGDMDGPRLRVSGQGISMYGGHSTVARRPEVSVLSTGNVANTPAEARSAARYQLSLGADIVKFTASSMEYAAPADGVMYRQELDDQMIREVIDQARAVDRLTASHCLGGPAATTSIEAGTTSIEHGHWLTDEQLDLMARRGTILVPAFSPLRQELALGHSPPARRDLLERILEGKLDTFRRAVASGVRIAAGSNAGTAYVRHGANAFELEFLVEAGLAPADAIVAATYVGAQAMGLERHVGVLQPGKLLDAVILDRNPLQDVGVLRAREHMQMIVQGARVLVDRRGQEASDDENVRMKVPRGLSVGTSERRSGRAWVA